jgi:hypothetical protein
MAPRDSIEPTWMRVFCVSSRTTWAARAKAASTAAASPADQRKQTLSGASGQTAGPRHGGGGVGDGRQRVVVDHDQFGGVAGLRERVGDDEGDAVADEADHVLRQRRMRRAVAEPVVGGRRRTLPGRSRTGWSRARRPRSRRR